MKKTFLLVLMALLVLSMSFMVFADEGVYATSSLTSSINSFPSTVFVSQSGCSGNIPKNGSSFVISGSYTPADTKNVSKSVNTGSSYPSSTYSYNEGGYTGTLSLNSVTDNGGYVTNTYSRYFSKTQDNVVTSYYDANGNLTNTTYSLGSSLNPYYYINEDGYCGNIPKTSTSLISGPTRYDNQDGSYRIVKIYRGYYNGTLYKDVQEWVSNYTGNYQGSVTRAESDTRVWKQNYAGMIY